MIAVCRASSAPEAASVQRRAVADQIRPEVPTLATIMDDAEPDMLAYMTFTKEGLWDEETGSPEPNKETEGCPSACIRTRGVQQQGGEGGESRLASRNAGTPSSRTPIPSESTLQASSPPQR